MGTLAATLSIKDSTTFSDEINFSVTDSLTTTAPSQGLTIQTITTADNQELVDEAVSGVFYFFARNTDDTNFVINDGNGLEARADTASCIIEYAYWAKG